jgi:preprotein translocase subunit YajC
MSQQMDLITQIIAQAAPSGGAPLAGMWPILLMFAAMYFLIIAPQRKKQKQHQKMITELTSGADVVTSGGLYGTITNVKDDRFVLRVAEGTKVEITKSSVATVLSGESESS